MGKQAGFETSWLSSSHFATACLHTHTHASTSVQVKGGGGRRRQQRELKYAFVCLRVCAHGRMAMCDAKKIGEKMSSPKHSHMGSNTPNPQRYPQPSLRLGDMLAGCLSYHSLNLEAFEGDIWVGLY